MTDRLADASAGRRRFLSLTGVGLGAALAGCSSVTDGGDGDGNGDGEDDTETTTATPEASVTVRLRNRDDADREYEVVVRQGEDVTNSFAGVLPANREQWVQMVATFRPTDERHELAINVGGSQRGTTWDPTDCDDYLVEATVEAGDPEFEAQCRSE